MYRVPQRLYGWWRGLDDHQRVQSTLVFSIGLLGLAHYLLFCIPQQFFIEDAGISFAYARNFVEGDGFVTYPGGERVEGFSNPSWTFLIAIFYAMGVEPWTSSKLLGAVFGLLTLPMVYGTARRTLIGRPDLSLRSEEGVQRIKRLDRLALLAPLLLVLSPQFAIWNASGLENSLFCFLLSAATFRVVKEGQEPEKRPLSALLFALLAMTRPEGIVYGSIGLLAVLVGAIEWRDWKRPLLWLAVLLIPWGLYQWWRHSYFAWTWPNTYYAKLGKGTTFEPYGWPEEAESGLNTRGWKYVIGYFQGHNIVYFFPFLALAMSGWRLWSDRAQTFAIASSRRLSAGRVLALLGALFMIDSGFQAWVEGGQLHASYFGSTLDTSGSRVVLGYSSHQGLPALVLATVTTLALARERMILAAALGMAGLAWAGMTMVHYLPKQALLTGNGGIEAGVGPLLFALGSTLVLTAAGGLKRWRSSAAAWILLAVAVVLLWNEESLTQLGPLQFLLGPINGYAGHVEGFSPSAITALDTHLPDSLVWLYSGYAHVINWLLLLVPYTLFVVAGLATICGGLFFWRFHRAAVVCGVLLASFLLSIGFVVSLTIFAETLDERGWAVIRVWTLAAGAVALGLLSLSHRGWRGRSVLWASMVFGVFFALYSGGDWMKQHRWFNLVSVSLMPLIAIGAATVIDALGVYWRIPVGRLWLSWLDSRVYARLRGGLLRLLAIRPVAVLVRWHRWLYGVLFHRWLWALAIALAVLESWLWYPAYGESLGDQGWIAIGPVFIVCWWLNLIVLRWARMIISGVPSTTLVRTVSPGLLLVLFGFYQYGADEFLRHSSPFAQKPETGVRDITRRVRYMSWVQQRLDVDDITLLDVDMGAHMYYSGWDIVDIAGLVDVPMARHSDFNKAFISEYIFQERDPEFAHVHGGWARTSKIPTHPEWKERYLEIPGYPLGRAQCKDKKYKGRSCVNLHVGNHIRKDLFVDSDRELPEDAILFGKDVSLVHLELPSPEVAPGGRLFIDSSWHRPAPNNKKKGSMDFRILATLDDGQGHRSSAILPPGYDWYKAAWEKDEVVHGRYRMLIPSGLPLGTYSLSIAILDETTGAVLAVEEAHGGDDSVPVTGALATGQVVRLVSSDDAFELAREDLRQALAAAESGDCEAGWVLWKNAERHVMKREEWRERQRSRVRAAIADCWVTASQTMSGRDDVISALVRARHWDHAIDALQAPSIALATQLDAEGDQAWSSGDVEASYSLWSSAMSLDPSLAWTRKKAEEARDLRLCITRPGRNQAPTLSALSIVPTKSGEGALQPRQKLTGTTQIQVWDSEMDDRIMCQMTRAARIDQHSTDEQVELSDFVSVQVSHSNLEDGEAIETLDAEILLLEYSLLKATKVGWRLLAPLQDGTPGGVEVLWRQGGKRLAFLVRDETDREISEWKSLLEPALKEFLGELSASKSSYRYKVLEDAQIDGAKATINQQGRLTYQGPPGVASIDDLVVIEVTDSGSPKQTVELRIPISTNTELQSQVSSAQESALCGCSAQSARSRLGLGLGVVLLTLVRRRS